MKLNTKVLQVRLTVLYRPLGEDGLAILDLNSRRVYQLQALGAYIFLQLDGRLSVNEVIQHAVTLAGRKATGVERKVLKFIRELFDLNLLVVLERRVRGGSKSADWLDRKKLNVALSSLKISEGEFGVNAAAGSCGSSGSGGCSSGCGSGGSTGSAAGGAAGGPYGGGAGSGGCIP